ncbi:hypothetical protein LTR95_008644 [Oleoguttula sp. CCFEE 5521]
MDDDGAITVFACNATKALGNAARTLADQDRAVSEAPKLMDLAVRLYSISESLEQPPAHGRPISSRRIAQYLTDLERICMWPPNKVWTAGDERPLTPSRFPKLHALSTNKLKASGISTPIRSYMSSVSIRKGLFAKLDSFLPKRREKRDEQIPEAVAIASELPRRIYDEFANALANNMQCDCPHSAGLDHGTRTHTARLELTRSIPKHGDDWVFQTALQVCEYHQAESLGRWKLLSFRVRRGYDASVKPQLSEHSISNMEDRINSLDPSAVPMASGGFCSLMLRRLGAVHHQVCVIDNDLYDSRGVIKSEQMLAQRPSISLAEALELNALSDDGKLLLAHSIANAVWECYGTRLMPVRWTSSRVHFLAESHPRQAPSIHFSPVHPYVTLSFENHPHRDGAVENEFVPSEGLVHWAPRVFALGVILISILGDENLSDRYDGSNWQESFNNLAFHCDRICANLEWPLLDIKTKLTRTTLRDAVTACLNGDLFNKRDATTAERKALIYNRVVWPLEYLKKIAGIRESSAVWTSMQFQTAVPVSAVPVSAVRNTGTTLSRKAGSGPEGWIARLVGCQLNYDIQAFNKQHKSARRTRIAIVDTGYDCESAIFAHTHRRNRIKGYKDFVESASAQDIDGHGTHVLSLAMRIAPSADVYVARVAKNSDDFVNGDDRIVQAINWAINEQEVDIVSMSFGWAEENEGFNITEAIRSACTKRRNRILFFAAASNSGADYGEWFPASHTSVTAVRATTHEGAFDTLNAPPDYAGADVLGTLGVDVPGASRDPEHPETLESGTSSATAITAAIAALVLEATRIGSTQENSVAYLDKLKSLSGMREMFRAKTMSRKVGERSWYLSAMPFCSLSKDERRIVLANAALNA